MGVGEAHAQELAKSFAREQDQPQAFRLWGGHRAAVDAFIPVMGQWRVAGTMAGLFYVALDYGAVRGVWADLGITAGAELWRQVRVLEDEARRVLNGGKQE